MEAVVKKYQQNFKKVREKMDQWEELQGVLVQQFRNASSIIERLETIQDRRSYGTLNCVDGIEESVFRKQLESLEIILLSMKKPIGEMQNIVDYMEKMHRNSGQLIKVGSSQPSTKQLHNRVGVKPCLADCLDGLRILYDMHHSEYLLKSSIVSALSSVAVKPSSSDLGALQQLLVDQPNIPKEEGGLKLYNTFLTSYLRRRSVEFIGLLRQSWKQKCTSFSTEGLQDLQILWRNQTIHWPQTPRALLCKPRHVYCAGFFAQPNTPKSSH